jgi:pimeloyl-ACP methyl ester carboxylesterase
MSLPWSKVDQIQSGLVTNEDHVLKVQREAIPIVFVPGIMGSRLRLAGTDGKGRTGKLPNLRWDTDTGWLLKNLLFKDAAARKALVIGEAFDPEYLEPDFEQPVGNGFSTVIRKYDQLLNALMAHDWRALNKLFVFSVHAHGYNWTGDASAAGAKLAARIAEIKQEATDAVGRCEGVILVTHSMGGLVARAACSLHGAEGSVLGVVHGVQPAWGSPAAYWRIKAGFEGGSFEAWLTSVILGGDGRRTTVILGNSIGGLELLPNKHYVLNDGRTKQWLTAKGPDGSDLFVPKPQSGNPYEDIYRIPAETEKPETGNPSTNTWWGLVDPDLLRPGELKPKDDDNAIDAVIGEAVPPAWFSYLALLAQAEAFHDTLGTYTHPNTRYLWGTGHKTAENVHFKAESNWVRSDPYPSRGFRGFYRNTAGEHTQAGLQDPAGDGDATVPVSSATFAGADVDLATSTPDPAGLNVEHQPAYGSPQAQKFVFAAITVILADRFDAERG